MALGGWMDGWMGWWMGGCQSQFKDYLQQLKNGPHLSCDLHKVGANLYSKLPIAPFSCKKVWYWMDGWMGGWMGAKAGLRIAYSNLKNDAKT